jgi:hypothetical protein
VDELLRRRRNWLNNNNSVSIRSVSGEAVTLPRASVSDKGDIVKELLQRRREQLNNNNSVSIRAASREVVTLPGANVSDK